MITETFQIGLIITAIGMGLVFAAIILLWGLMTLLVRLDAHSENKLPAASRQPQESPALKPVDPELTGEMIAIVAVALALSGKTTITPSIPPDKPHSPWQQIQRARAIQEVTRLFSRQNQRT